MATATLGDIFNDARGFLADTGYLASIPSGEWATNAVLPVFFGEPYRTMFGRLQGASKRVQRVVELVLPAQTTVLIPSTYGIEDFSEPEMIEERPLGSTPLAILSTNTASPIQVTTAAPHSLTTGSIVEGTLYGIPETSAPWGHWFATVTGASTFALRGSASDGVAGGVGGWWVPDGSAVYTEVQPIDLSAQGRDGQTQSVLGVYLWINEQLQFRGCSSVTQLRITYYASGSAPTNPNYVLGIDNCRDFLAVATAANAAASRGWSSRAEELRRQAYGDPSDPLDQGGLLGTFMAVQIMSAQRGPQRRQLPFRDKRSRYGTYLIG